MSSFADFVQVSERDDARELAPRVVFRGGQGVAESTRAEASLGKALPTRAPIDVRSAHAGPIYQICRLTVTA
jgi:hypothetical protein